MSNFEGHTPGPWELSEPNGPNMGWRCGPAWLGTNTTNAQGLADAHLITAAPDLLVENQQLRDILAEAVFWIEDTYFGNEYIMEDWYHAARAALLRGKHD